MRKIVIYGAGSSGRRALHYYGREQVLYFCDGDERKVGTLFEGIEVISRDALLHVQDEADILVASVFYEEIAESLFAMGIREVKRFVCYEESCKWEDRDIAEKLNYRRILAGKEERKEEEAFSDSVVQEDIVFVIVCQAEWIVVKSVYENCADLNRAVAVCGDSELFQRLRGEGVRCFRAQEYRLEERKPHVVVYVNDFVPDYEKYFFGYERAKRNSDKLVFIPFDMVLYGRTRIESLAARFLRQNADMEFVNPDCYEKFKPYQDNLYLEGNPKFDYIYNKLQHGVDVPKGWKEKIGNKPVALWGITHGLTERGVDALYSFDIWFESIVTYFLEHREYVLIFRPHIFIFDELVRRGIWSYSECKNFEALFNKEENLILDLEKDYGASYNLSDVLISDASGLLLSYLSTKKPIIYTATRRMGYTFSDPQLIENYYIAKDREEFRVCMKRVFEEGDPLYSERMVTRERYIPKFDGAIGCRIAKQIKREMKK